jgi:hypothetical protein
LNDVIIGDIVKSMVRTDMTDQSDGLSASNWGNTSYPVSNQLHAAVQATQSALKDSHSELLTRHNELAEQMKVMIRMMVNVQPASARDSSIPSGAYAMDYDLALSVPTIFEEKKSHTE